MKTSIAAEAEPPRISAQQRILAVIREWIQQRGYPPTVREIGAAVGLRSTSSVAYYRGSATARTRAPGREPIAAVVRRRRGVVVTDSSRASGQRVWDVIVVAA
jgi:repressor LexA